MKKTFNNFNKPMIITVPTMSWEKAYTGNDNDEEDWS